MTPQQLLNKDTAKHMREIHKAILNKGLSEPEACTYSNCEIQLVDDSPVGSNKTLNAIMLSLCVILATALVLIVGCEKPAHASPSPLSISGAVVEGYKLDQWADAIKRAENSHSHPYGIMAHYRHTSPRQACINTVKHQYRVWCKNNCNMPFLAFLASKYAPIGASNDPKGLNRHWAANVKYFLDKERV